MHHSLCLLVIRDVVYFTWTGGHLVWSFAWSVCHLFSQLFGKWVGWLVCGLVAGLLGWLVFGMVVWLVGSNLEEMLKARPWLIYPCKQTL